MKSQKIQEEVSKDGFDFKNVEDCINKLLEELNEYKDALQAQNEKNLIDEGGDLLFSAINILRKSGINSEEALNYANTKFVNRYRKAEELASDDGFQFKEITISQKERTRQRTTSYTPFPQPLLLDYTRDENLDDLNVVPNVSKN